MTSMVNGICCKITANKVSNLLISRDKQTGHVAPLYYHPEDAIDFFNAV